MSALTLRGIIAARLYRLADAIDPPRWAEPNHDYTLIRPDAERRAAQVRYLRRRADALDRLPG